MSAPQNVLDALKTLEGYLEVGSPVSDPPQDPPPMDENTVLEPYGIVNPPTTMTIFGLNWDGKTFDPEDNGVGAWGANTREPSTIGCALPIRLLQATFGGITPSHLKGVELEFYSHFTQKTVRNVDLVDEGPAARVHRLCDGTWGLHQALGHIDAGLAKWGTIWKAWPAGFLVSYWITDGQGKAVKIQGVDFTKGRIIGS